MSSVKLRREIFEFYGKDNVVKGKGQGAMGPKKNIPVDVKTFYGPKELAKVSNVLQVCVT